MKAQLHIAHLLDIGKTRSVQQDQLVCGYLDDEKIWQFDVNGILATNTSLSVLSDGMGGTAAGEVASQLVVNVIKEHISDHFPQDGPGDIKLLLSNAIAEANMAIKQHVVNNPSTLNMGATVVLCLVTDEVAHIMWVGDSRCYQLRGEKLMQLTKDHSLVQRLIEAGEISTEEAQSHPNKNIITQSLSGKAYKPDYVAASFKEGDSLLICSDGLTSMLADEEIKKELLTSSPDVAVKQLGHKANIEGGLDNISIILLKRPLNLREVIQDVSVQQQVQKKRSRKSQGWIMGLLIFVMSTLFMGLNIYEKPKVNSISEQRIIEAVEVNPVSVVEEKIMDAYPESGPGNQKFYIRLGTFAEANTANQYQNKMIHGLPSNEDIMVSSKDTIYELKTRFFQSRKEAQSYLSTYLSENEGIIINASNE